MGSLEDPYRAERTAADDTPSSTARVSADLPSMDEKQPPSSNMESSKTAMASDASISAEGISDDAPQGNEPRADGYPKGLPLLFIVVAVILGIFLASLDMASPPFPLPHLSVLTPRH